MDARENGGLIHPEPLAGRKVLRARARDRQRNGVQTRARAKQRKSAQTRARARRLGQDTQKGPPRTGALKVNNPQRGPTPQRKGSRAGAKHRGGMRTLPGGDAAASALSMKNRLVKKKVKVGGKASLLGKAQEPFAEAIAAPGTIFG